VINLTPSHVKGLLCNSCALPDLRELLSAAIPAKAIAELISKCGRPIKVWLELGIARCLQVQACSAVCN